MGRTWFPVHPFVAFNRNQTVDVQNPKCPLDPAEVNLQRNQKTVKRPLVPLLFLITPICARSGRLGQIGSIASATTVSLQAVGANTKSPGSACYLGTSNRQNQNHPRMKLDHPSHCASHAPSVADRCASWRPSGADRSPEPEHPPESRPHDEKPVFRPFPSPTLTAPVKERLWFSAFHASQPEPDHHSKAYKSARSHAKDPNAEPPNPAMPAKR